LYNRLQVILKRLKLYKEAGLERYFAGKKCLQK